MEDKGFIFLVETIYERVSVTESEGQPVRTLELDTHVVTFTDEKYNKVRSDAQREMDRIIRYGLSMSGGSVVKSRILPSAIKQVGLVDYKMWMKEQQLIQAESATDAADVPETAVVAEVAPEQAVS